MTERATVVYGRARVVALVAGRKPPNKVRTGGETRGMAASCLRISHDPFTWRDWESLSKHSYMERFTIYHVNRVYMLGLSGLHAPFRFYMD